MFAFSTWVPVHCTTTPPAIAVLLQPSTRHHHGNQSADLVASAATPRNSSPSMLNTGQQRDVLVDVRFWYSQGFHAYWKVSESAGFFSKIKISGTWKVLKNEFGPGKFWKLKFEVLEVTCGST